MFVYYLSYHYIYGADATGQKNAYELRKLLPRVAHLKKKANSSKAPYISESSFNKYYLIQKRLFHLK